ncbi:MAG TPA: LssY C-terminal domain-containing protein [Candidatus Sulfotelmatobacter sp.]|nr:LssY C-terminal domain-containing protein [Candidatus Sulfotelmatobacter sp.]
MNSQRKGISRRTIVCLFSACVLAALGFATQKGARALVPDAEHWQDAVGQEPTAGNTRTPNGEKPKVITDAQIPDEDAGEDELEPAAVSLDQSGTTLLIQELYQATRLTKEKEILEHLNRAQQLIASGTDIKGTDGQGRTALHWAVFGSSYSTKPSTLIKYEEIADALVAGGVDINKEDLYQDTALDYSLYAPTFEIQTLLIEHGASSGFLAAYFQFFNDRGDGPPKTPELLLQASRKADLVPGNTLSLRLDTPVYSDRSRTGDPITATVTYPLCKSGEDIACADGELVVPPGSKVNGTILFAAKAPDKYSRPRLVLDFSNILHKDGTKSPLYARVIDVDNARETVRNNEILGIIQPHAGKKLGLAMIAVSAANPIAGYTVKGVQTVYGLSIRREIMFPAGTDLQVQVVRPSMLRQKAVWTGWKQLPVDAELTKLATTAPMRTATPGNVPSDPTNLMFLGSEKQVIAAFGEAGWFEADNLSAKSALKVAQATLRQTGYGSAPMSTLTIGGRPPDLMFQKSLDTFAKRHHVRVWKLQKTYQGQQVWVAAATHDIATQNSAGGTKWTHRIDPHVDREREWVQTDLLFVGTGVGYVNIDRPTAPKKLGNATGDTIVTDGRIAVVQMVKVKSDVVEAGGN